ncbi:hypothetical protein KRMM14A1259_35090 [Krasilnikovia sp. MM14-A1259]
MTVTGIALIGVGVILLVAFRAVLFGGRARRRASRQVTASRRAELPAAPEDGPWAAELPAASPDGPWAADQPAAASDGSWADDLPAPSADGPWASDPPSGGSRAADEPEVWGTPGGRRGRAVRGAKGSGRPRDAEPPVPATGRSVAASADADSSRRHFTAPRRTARGRSAPGGFADGPDRTGADGPARSGRNAGRAQGERRTVWLDPDPEAGDVMPPVPVVAGAADIAPGSAPVVAGPGSDDHTAEPASRRPRRRRGSSTAPVRRRRRRGEEDEDSPFVLASLGLADDDPDGRDGLDDLPTAGRPGGDPDAYGSTDDPERDGPAESGGLPATLLDGPDDERGDFRSPDSAAQPLSSYRVSAPAPRGWPAERADSRYGDRVDGWVRPQYRELPEAETAGAYWTPAPDGPYVEPSASGYGWPVQVERLPAAPPYEPVAGFDLPPVSDLTTVVPNWPTIGRATPSQPRYAPARDSGAGILWGSARDDTVWGDSTLDEAPEVPAWPATGSARGQVPGPAARSGPTPDPVPFPDSGPMARSGPMATSGPMARAGQFEGSGPQARPDLLGSSEPLSGSGRLARSGPLSGSASVPGAMLPPSGAWPQADSGRPREFGPSSGVAPAPMQGLGPVRGFGRPSGIGRPAGLGRQPAYGSAPGFGSRPEAVPLPADERDPRVRPRPRPRPRPGGAEVRSTVYVSRHAADPG